MQIVARSCSERGIYLVKLTDMRQHLKDVGLLDSDGRSVIPREEILKMVREFSKVG